MTDFASSELQFITSPIACKENEIEKKNKSNNN